MMRNRIVVGFLLGVLVLTGLACNVSELSTMMTTPSPAAPAGTPTPVIVVLTPTPVSPDVTFQADIEEQLVINVYARVSPAVVCVTAAEHFGNCIGSGFVIDKQGHIVTNNHVAEALPELLVTLADEHTVPAEVVGTVPSLHPGEAVVEDHDRVRPSPAFVLNGHRGSELLEVPDALRWC